MADKTTLLCIGEFLGFIRNSYHDTLMHVCVISLNWFADELKELSVTHELVLRMSAYLGNGTKV